MPSDESNLDLATRDVCRAPFPAGAFAPVARERHAQVAADVPVEPIERVEKDVAPFELFHAAGEQDVQGTMRVARHT